jgi:predicted small metal-binding protein
MKEFACAQVVPGCDFKATAESDDEILQQVAAHAREAHGMDEVPAEVAEKVKAGIREV